MAAEARFTVAACYRNDEEAIVNRVAQVIGYDGPPQRQDHGYRWMLNSSNDWWLGQDPETGEYIIAGRYADQGLIHALALVLSYIFH